MTLLAQAALDAPLSTAMREGSRAEHEAAESSSFIGELLAGRVSEAGYTAYLLRLLAEMQPQAENFVWLGWMTAAAVLGYEDLAPHAEELFRRGLASEQWQGVEDFRGDLERTLRDPDGMAGFDEHDVRPFTGAIEELSKWHGYSGKDDATASGLDYEVQQPITNPLRGVGRNDPCPCGSGRKYKKCCWRRNARGQPAPVNGSRER